MSEKLEFTGVQLYLDEIAPMDLQEWEYMSGRLAESSLVQSLWASLSGAPLFPVYSEQQRQCRKRYRRAIRKSRAAFRRRKRGLV